MPFIKVFRPYLAPQPRAIGWDPMVDLPRDHYARFVEEVVEEAVPGPSRGPGLPGPGQPEYDPRLLVKVLIYGYATGVRSSRRLAQLCRESLAYLLLTRGDHPSYHTLCEARRTHTDLIELCWVALFASAQAAGMRRVGQIVVDSMKLPANLSREMVLDAEEFAPVLGAVRQVLAEAEAKDAQEEAEVRLPPQRVPRERCEQMRDIVRRVRATLAGRKAPEQKPVVTRCMRRQLKKAQQALEEAQAEQQTRLCLTDPEAHFMRGGREKELVPAYSLETAIDKGAKLQVAHGVSPEGNDNGRLEPLVEAAREHEPDGVHSGDGDSGYYRSDVIRRLLEAGVDLCVPDSHTAGALHRGGALGQPGVPLLYEEEGDCYRCAEGMLLRPWKQRDLKEQPGESVLLYRAQTSCRKCPRQAECFRRTAPKGNRKVVTRRVNGELLREGQARFAEEAFRERYRQRGSFVEGMFGYLRGALGYTRWLLRGRTGVCCEERLLSLAYQSRRVYRAWAPARMSAGSG